MRFSFILATLGAFLASSIAGAAPLDASLAGGLDHDPQFAGCPAIGAGESQPEPHLCQGMGTAADFCAYYQATPSLKAYGEAETARRACVDFYQAGIEAQQLICDYERDAKAIQLLGLEQANSANGALGATKAARATVSCSRKIFLYYLGTAQKMRQRIPEYFSRSRRQLDHIADLGAQVLKAEVNCQKDGQPGAPPGFLLEGLSAVGLDDQKNTVAQLDPILAKFNEILQAESLRARGYTDEMARRGGSLSTITGEPQIKGPGTAEKVREGAPSASANDDVAPFFFRSPKNIGSDLGTVAAANVVNGQKAVDLEVLLRHSAPEALKGAARDNAAGFLISAAIMLGTSGGKVSAGDLANLLASTGVAVVGSLVGAPGLPVIVAVEVVSEIGSRLQASWNAYDGKVEQAFTAFAKDYVKTMATASSQQVAQAYRPKKLTLAYCSKCTSVDVAHGCPGFTGYTHGLNPSYLGTSTDPGNPLLNPWVRNSFNKLRQRGPSSTPFTGPGEVSPVSTAP